MPFDENETRQQSQKDTKTRSVLSPTKKITVDHRRTTQIGVKFETQNKCHVKRLRVLQLVTYDKSGSAI